MSAANERSIVGGILIDTNLTPFEFTKAQIAFPNMDFIKPEGKAWARLSFKNGLSFRLELGRSGIVATRRFPGTVYIQVFVPINTGDLVARNTCEGFRALFEDQVYPFTNGSIRFRMATIEEVGATDAYYQFNVSIPFVRDLVS